MHGAAWDSDSWEAHFLKLLQQEEHEVAADEEDDEEDEMDLESPPPKLQNFQDAIYTGP